MYICGLSLSLSVCVCVCVCVCMCVFTSGGFNGGIFMTLSSPSTWLDRERVITPSPTWCGYYQLPDIFQVIDTPQILMQ